MSIPKENEIMDLYYCEKCKCKDYCLSREPSCPCCGLFHICNSREACSLGHKAGIHKFICDDAMLINEPCTECVVYECPKNEHHKNGE